MPSLDKALIDIAAVRSQIARSTVFRGYGPATFAATGLLAGVAGLLQAYVLPDPAANMLGYLALWIGTAALAGIIIGIEVVNRTRRIHSGLADEMIMQAIEQFLPAAAAGIFLTLILLRFAPETLWMLPGLWQIVLSLGVLASCRTLPAGMVVAGIWYMVTGLACLAYANGANAFAPFAMAVPFAIGQFIAAAAVQTLGGADESA